MVHPKEDIHPREDMHPREELLRAFVRRLDEAVAAGDPQTVCRGVKAALEVSVRGDDAWVPPALLRPAPDRYARRLLHRDPHGRYSVVVMVWDRGQGTPLHDHGGLWCVECVYRGRIRIGSFDAVGSPSDEVVRFAAAGETVAEVGAAGSLIPPHEYHWIRNEGETPAVTIHVYAGEMTSSRVFWPRDDGTWRRETCTLSYTA